MTSFTKKPLGMLDNIYKFVGGVRGVSSIDLGSDIQLVHDVSRQAEREGFSPSRWLWTNRVVAGGAGDHIVTQAYSELWVYLQQYQLGDFDAYITRLGAWLASIDKADLTSGSVIMYSQASTFNYVSRFGQPSLVTLIPDLLEEWDGVTEVQVTGPTEYAVASQGAAGLRRLETPVLWKPSSSLSYLFTTGAACTVYAWADVWVGSKGCTPPGLP